MWEDPIVAEVHKARRDIFARFSGDMDAYFRYLREREEEERKRGREIITWPVGPFITPHAQRSRKPEE
jgi:hypothetical protein